MKADIYFAINEFKQTQKTFEQELQKLIQQLKTDVNPAMVWVGFKGESKEAFINKLKNLADGLENLDMNLWKIKLNGNHQVMDVVKPTLSGSEIKVTRDEIDQFISQLSVSFKKDGDLNKKLDILADLTYSKNYYNKFLSQYLNDNRELSLKIILPFQRLTRFPLLLNKFIEIFNKDPECSENNIKNCQSALEIVNSKIAETNNAVVAQLSQSVDYEKLERAKIAARVKLSELNTQLHSLAQAKRGIFRDKLKAPMQQFITEVGNFLTKELGNVVTREQSSKLNVSNYAASLRSGLQILQGIKRYKGNGAELREISLPIISQILNSIRPTPPAQPRPNPHMVKKPTKPAVWIPRSPARLSSLKVVLTALHVKGKTQKSNAQTALRPR